MSEQAHVFAPVHLADDTLLDLTPLGHTILAEARVADALACTPGWPGINDPQLVEHLAMVAVHAIDAR